MFQLHAPYRPTGDQPEAIRQLVDGVCAGAEAQTLLGVTGSGKTFTIANVISQINRPTLILSHNKTLAAQLYSEMRQFFPNNAVEYFVSYYDYYQPEAYIPSTDTYIEKDLSINEEIDRLRLSAISALLSGRKDVCTFTFDMIRRKDVRITAERIKAMTGAAMKERTTLHLKVNPSPDMSPYAVKVPSKAYVNEAFTAKNLRTTRMIRDESKASINALQPSRTEGKCSAKACPTSPAPAYLIASRRAMNTSQLKSLLLIAHVGPYTPRRASYSLAKNQRAATDRNNMRQSISILQCPSDSHHGELVSHILSSFGQILYMEGEITEMELLTELERLHVMEDRPFYRL